MDKEAISNCVGPLSRDYLSKLPHHVAPCMNLHRIFPCQETSANDSALLLRQFPFGSTLPVPFTQLSSVERPILSGFDPTTSLIKEKIRWQLKKDKIVKAVQKDKKSISGKLIKKAVNVPVDNKAVVPRGVVLLAQHLDRDPDPCFSGVNNWYYSGGTLATLKVNEDHYLLHASENKLNCSKVVDQSTSEKLCEVSLQNEFIHQIKTNEMGAAVRQKTVVSVFAADETDSGDVQLRELLSVSDKGKPLLSAALRHKSLNQFCTLSCVKSFHESVSVLKLWDVEYKKKCKERVMITQIEGTTVSDNWSGIEFVDDQTLLLANRCCVSVLDARAGFEKKHLAWCPKNLVEMCEEISHVVPSCSQDQMMYVTTSHQALCLDLRFGFVQRWTHMMASPPQYAFTHPVTDQLEVLCLGSQAMSDCVAVVNLWKGEDPESVYKPSSLPPPAISLLQARQHGLCLDPSLTQRCCQSMTGLTWLPADQGVHVVRQSTTADVFIQHLTWTEDVDTEMTQSQLTAFSDWSQPTLALQREASTVEVTNVDNLSSIAKALRTPNIPIQKEVDGKSALKGSWLMSKKYMEECVDMLASRILDVWEVDDEDEWATMGERQDDSFEEDPSEKVLNWLDKADEEVSGAAEVVNTQMTNDFSQSLFLLKSKATSTPFPPQASLVPPEYGTRMTQPSQLSYGMQTTQPTQLSLDSRHTPHRMQPSQLSYGTQTTQPTQLSLDSRHTPHRMQPSQLSYGTQTTQPTQPSLDSRHTPHRMQPSQLSYGTQTTQPTQPSLDTRHTPHRSPPSSSGSTRSHRKKQKLLSETPVKVQHKPTSASKHSEVVKKKYIPGF